MAKSSTVLTVWAALAGNLMVALAKSVAAAMTGSAAMTSEAVHSLIDTLNEVLLLYGIARSKRPADRAHPLGYGRELYFWSFVVALLLFALGAGFSIYEGITQITDPTPIDNVPVNYVVLGLSFLFEGASWSVALNTFHASKGPGGYWEAIRKSKDPPSFIVLLEDSAALIGISIAAVGIYLSARLQRPELDGFASILIGMLLAATSWLLARESKELLIGEPAHGSINASIRALAESESCIEGVNEVLTVHLAPNRIVAILRLEFSDGLRTPEIERCVE